MALNEFDAHFQTVVRETGAAYVKARQSIVEMGTAALAPVQARLTAVDWKVVLAAEILNGWLTRKDLFDQATEYVRGNLPGLRPITGAFTALQRARMVEQLGRDVVPLLLELVVKTPVGDAEQRQAVFGALQRLGDPRAVPVMLDLLAATGDQQLRILAADTLGELKDARAAGPLEGIVEDRSQSTDLRGVSAISIGKLRAPHALPLLEKVLLDESADLDLRKSAARGIDSLADTRATAALLRALDRKQDRELLLVIVDTLGDLGDASAIPALDRLARGHADRFVRESAQAARESIAARLQ